MLSLSQACIILDEALAYARASELDPMTVAALDGNGCIVALKMEDGSGLFRPELASGQAWSALALGLGTRRLGGGAAPPAFFRALADVVQAQGLTTQGGMVVRSEAGEIIGAVGASGDAADNNEACVIAGIKAAGLRGDTGAAVG